MRLPEIPAERLRRLTDSPRGRGQTIRFCTTSCAQDLPKPRLPPSRDSCSDPAEVDDRASVAAKIETPDTEKTASFRCIGAAAFVDGEEKSFLESYSDFIWWGLMGLSAMGSIGAWLRAI